MLYKSILLCSDMDRTIIPNGAQPESEQARPILKRITELNYVKLCYVSGRDIDRILSAIEAYKLPSPDFIIADVGTSVYHNNSQGWQLINPWLEQLSDDWGGFRSDTLAKRVGEFKYLVKQQENQQGRFKLSYQVTPSALMNEDLPFLDSILRELMPVSGSKALKYKVVTSIDETRDEGLVDVLPQSAGKLGAVRFLVDYLDIDKDRVYFSGDSGNDRDVLLSEYKSCLVNNATEVFKEEIRQMAKNLEDPQNVYVASGDSIANLNGNYSAGVVEGLLHFFPELKSELAEGAL